MLICTPLTDLTRRGPKTVSRNLRKLLDAAADRIDYGGFDGLLFVDQERAARAVYTHLRAEPRLSPVEGRLRDRKRLWDSLSADDKEAWKEYVAAAQAGLVSPDHLLDLVRWWEVVNNTVEEDLSKADALAEKARAEVISENKYQGKHWFVGLDVEEEFLAQIANKTYDGPWTERDEHRNRTAPAWYVHTRSSWYKQNFNSSSDDAAG